MSTLKNWWLQIATVLLAVLDLGFDVINPLIAELGVPDKVITVLKVAFGIYALLKSKIQLPTQNMEKLQNIVDVKVEEEIGLPIPPKKK